MPKVQNAYSILGKALIGHTPFFVLGLVMVKAGFWKTHAGMPFNERQRKVLNRLLDGFEGKLTTTKYAKLTQCSPDTALRDISQLVEQNVLGKDQAGGRSTSYSLCLTGSPGSQG